MDIEKGHHEIGFLMIANSTPRKITMKFRILLPGSDFEYSFA